MKSEFFYFNSGLPWLLCKKHNAIRLPGKIQIKMRQETDSTIKKEQIRQKKKLLGKWMIILTVFLTELFLYTLCRVNYTETGFNISREKRIQKGLKNYREELIIEHERLLSPDRIAQIARTKLDLRIPDPSQVIYMDM